MASVKTWSSMAGGRVLPQPGVAGRSGEQQASEGLARVRQTRTVDGGREDRSWAPAPMSGYEPMIINVALTGAVVTKAHNPAVPVTPEEIAADAIACARAGAAIVHLHVRDEAGRQVHRAELYQRAIGAMRESVPELIVCGTTTGRAGSTLADRRCVLDLPLDVRPDMASLTLGSFNFPTVASVNPPEVITGLLEAMAEREVVPELEVFELGMVNTLRVLQERGLVAARPYVNILLGSLGSAPAFIQDLGHIVERLPVGTEWAAAGIGAFQRAMVMVAAAAGGNVRTGLEDAPVDIHGRPSSNVDAVHTAVAAAELAGRAVATPAEARTRLGLRRT
jgi:3-keto-5-aminohexanoate cleavage enzyme